MSSSYANAFQTLRERHKEALNWTSGSVRIVVAISLTNDEPNEINLTDTIGKCKRQPPIQDDSNCHWLHSSLNQNEEAFRRAQIHPMFIRACRDAGFKVHARYRSDRSAIIFSCIRDSYYDEEKEAYYTKKRPRKVKHPHLAPIAKESRTQRPIKDDEDNDDTCCFKFAVYWDSAKSRWYLPHKQAGCANHCGHLQIDPSLLRLNLKHALPEPEQKLAKDSLDSKISATSTASLMETRTGENLEWHQLHYLKSRDKNRLVMNSGAATPVDRLIAQLAEDPTVSYTGLFAEYKSGLVTIKTKKMNKNSATEIEKFAQDLNDATDSPEAFAETIRSSLQDSSNGEILLALAWTTDDARRKFDMFPEFMGGDDTEDTNSEERPLYTLLGKDSNNQSFAHTWVYMPSKAEWAFSWIFRHAVQTLHPGTAPMRVQLILSDADPQETRAIEGACGNGNKSSMITIKIFPNGSSRWCGWHRINRNFTHDSKYKAILAAAKNSSIFTRVEIDVLVRWLWYYIKHYETEDEVQLSLTLMNFYLNEMDQENHFGHIDDRTREKIKEFITKQFQEYGHKLFEASFEGMTMGNATTSINEAEHRAIKKHTAGPRPQHDLAESQDRIQDIHKKKEKRKAKKVAHDVTSNFAKASDREKFVTGLTTYVNHKLCVECIDEAPKQVVYRASEDLFYVKRDYDKYDTTPREDLDLPAAVCQALSDQLDGDMKKLSQKNKKKIKLLKDKLLGDKSGNLPEYQGLVAEVCKYLVPRFERTRELKIVYDDTDNSAMLVCSCKIFKKNGYACRCMYKLLNRMPKLSDAKVRWHLSYLHFYGRDDEASKQYVMIRDFIEPDMMGVPITAEEVSIIKSEYDIGTGGKDEEFFTRSLNKLYLRGANNYWQKNARKFTYDVSKHFGSVACAQEGGEPEAGSEDNMDDEEKVTTHHSTAGSGVSVARPFGVSRQVQGSSQYVVPSQSEDGLIGLADFLDGDGTVGSNQIQGTDSYNNYLHIYQTACKFADANKGAGRKMLQDGLNSIKARIARQRNEIKLELPMGPLGISLRESNGHCVVAAPETASASSAPTSPLCINDIILSLNGIELNKMQGAAPAWGKLFAAFSEGDRNVVILRPIGATGLGSIPQTASKRIPKRKPKASSPNRGSKRTKRK